MISILIVLDIEETILQFIPRQNYNLWTELSSKHKEFIEDKFDYIDNIYDKNCIIFRYGFNKFINEIKKNKRIKLALWSNIDKSLTLKMSEYIMETFDFFD